MENPITKYKACLARYLPQEAVEPMFVLLTQTNKVRFRITRGRRSKLGDYRCPYDGHECHEITVNGDLNPHYFLLVLLHEVGHLNTWKLHRGHVSPHGHEWQQEYRSLLTTYLELFPPDVAALIAQYVRYLPLNRALARQIEMQLRHYDKNYNPDQDVTLDTLPIGTCFRIKDRNFPTLQSLEKRRTRYKCRDVKSGSLYLVSGTAPVEVADDRAGCRHGE